MNKKRMQHKSYTDDFEEVFIAIDEPIYNTGVVCRILDIPVWVLKQLDNEGFVCPPRKSSLRSRLYSKRELKQLERCWYYMKERSVKVTGLRVILEIEGWIFE